MKKLPCLAIVAAVSMFGSAGATAADEPGPFYYRDGLRARDEWGKLHQMPDVNSTDFAHRYSVRFHYYFKGRRTLEADPAYVAAVQRDLKRLGYYCGPLDGIYTDDVSIAIAKLQKNYGLQVTGTLNVAVRRALRLP
jgi:hypothetical protein